MYISPKNIREVDSLQSRMRDFESPAGRCLMSWRGGKRYAPASIGPDSWYKGGRGIGPRIAVVPEWSAGRRECSRKLVYPMSWPEGGEIVPSLSL